MPPFTITHLSATFRHKSLSWLAVLTLLVCLPNVRAAESTNAPAGPFGTNAFLNSLAWSIGPTNAKIKTLAEVKVPEGFAFTDEKGTQDLLERMGNPINKRELGFLAPKSLKWFVVFEFDDVGFVKDDDKDKLDADKLLDTIKKGTEASNERRKEMGVPPLKIIGWEQPPKYNEKTHNLEWSIRAESEGRPVINHNVRVLGRRGVMEVALVGKPENLEQAMPVFNEILAGYSYQNGETYAEYRQGDKLAQFGLAALVAGGVAVGAAKLGLFAWLAVFLKKGWKLIVVAVAAVGNFFKRIIFGRDRNKSDEQSS